MALLYQNPIQGTFPGPTGASKPQGLLSLLQSPEIMGLAMGLLSGSQPTTDNKFPTFGGALAQGLGTMQQFGDIDRQRKLAEARLSLDEKYFDLEQEHKAAQIKDLLEKGLERQRRGQAIRGYIYGPDTGATLEGEPIDQEVLKQSFQIPEEVRREAQALYDAGFDEEAMKVIAKGLQKPESEKPAAGTISANQELIQDVDGLIPQLERLKEAGIVEIPGVPGGQLFSKVMNYKETSLLKKRITDAAKEYAKIKVRGKPTQASINEAKEILMPAPGENVAEWKTRIDEVIADLYDRRSYAASIVKPLGAGMETEAAKKHAPVSKKTVSLYKKGKKYNIPENLAEEALAADFTEAP